MTATVLLSQVGLVSLFPNGHTISSCLLMIAKPSLFCSWVEIYAVLHETFRTESWGPNTLALPWSQVLLFISASDFGVWEGRAVCQGMRRVVLGLSVGIFNHLGHYEAVTALIVFCPWAKFLKVAGSSEFLFTLRTWGSQRVYWWELSILVVWWVSQNCNCFGRAGLLQQDHSAANSWKSVFATKRASRNSHREVWAFPLKPIQRNMEKSLVLFPIDILYRILEYIHWHSAND